MKEKLRVNPSKTSILFFRRRNSATGGTPYVVGNYLGQTTTRHCQYPRRKSIISPATVKTLLDLVCKPVIIGAFIIAVCIVGSVYALSQWYYADFDPEPIPTEIPVSKLAESPVLLVSMDLSSLLSSDAESDWGVVDTAKPTQTKLGTDSYELTPEAEALLLEHFAETLPDPTRESPHGLGPYPEVPSDYPRQNVWEELEKSYYEGYATIEHELIHRVLIKLWRQGKKTDSGVLNDQNGRVYPLYRDTVYIKRREYESEGTFSMLSHGSLGQYEDAVREGTQPSWLKVVRREDGGIDPSSFLDLP